MPNSQAKTRKQRKQRLNEKWKIVVFVVYEHKKWKKKQELNKTGNQWSR